MGRLTDTEQIRIYCNNNPGGVLDLSYASKRIFKDIPIDNLRKYLSRLCEEGVITKISKGIFLIGHSEKSDLERIINYYADDTFGMIAGEELLYRFGLIDYKPDIIEIFTNKTSGNKYIEKLGVQLIENQSNFLTILGSRNIAIALELIAHESLIAEVEKPAYYLKLSELLKRYSDRSFRYDHKIIYKRLIYIKLESILKSMGISNRVMDIYDNKTRISNNTK